MRTRSHTSGPSWRINLNSDPIPHFTQAPSQTSALDLPGEQKFGLVHMMKEAGDTLAPKIIAHLNETGIPFPVGRHWHELRRDGYATRERTGHKLTPLGRGAAQTIMRDLAVKFDVHHFTRSGGRGTGRGTSTLCSCGKFGRGPFTNTDIGEQHLRRAEDGHLRDVANGFPKTRAMTDFLNEVDPPRFNFNSGDAPQVSSPMMNAGGPDDPGTDARCVSVSVPGRLSDRACSAGVVTQDYENGTRS